MGRLESSDIIFGILYATAAIMLFVVSYMYFIKRFKRNKLEALSSVTLSTSRYDIYESKTQFLIETSESMPVRLVLLDEDENELEVLLDENLFEGENVVDFDPEGKEDGIYYLSLKAKTTSILRRIRIHRT